MPENLSVYSRNGNKTNGMAHTIHGKALTQKKRAQRLFLYALVKFQSWINKALTAIRCISCSVADSAKRWQATL